MQTPERKRLPREVYESVTMSAPAARKMNFTGRLGLPQRTQFNPELLPPNSPLRKYQSRPVVETTPKLEQQSPTASIAAQRPTVDHIPGLLMEFDVTDMAELEDHVRRVVAPLVMNVHVDPSKRQDILWNFVHGLVLKNQVPVEYEPAHIPVSSNLTLEQVEADRESPNDMAVSEEFEDLDAGGKENEQQTPSPKQHSRPVCPRSVPRPQTLRTFAISDADESRAIAFTPVRLARKKDREAVGAEYVVTPVRRSVRRLTAFTTDEMERDGLKPIHCLFFWFLQL